MNDNFKLPYDIPIYVGECEELNAWYYYEDVPPYSEIVICYELIDEIAYYKSQQYEDADLINAARLDKDRVVVVSESKIIHRVGGSFDSVATRYLSHRNHARNGDRWRWLYKEANNRAWNAETTITHGRVAVIGNHPKLVSELRQQNISVATLRSVEELSNRKDRDDVVVVEHKLDEAADRAPRAEITTPGEVSAALTRAGIAPSSTPPRPRFSSIASALSRRW